MSILMTEYDYATDMAVLREESYEDGLFAGLATGREEGISIGLATGREEGISIGLERGAYQNKLETARRLVIRGFSSEDIADLTGLDILQIDELRS